MTSEYLSELSEVEIQIVSSTSKFPIVGIVASAGGLEAFSQLLGHLATNTGMAFVLIQHMLPNGESLLTKILARVTKMLVSQVQNGMLVEPDRVYIIPPDTQMRIFKGVFELSPREKVFGTYMPGDVFLISLAADRGNRAIAVVLSGSNKDGTLGLTAIKVVGGVTFAQDKDTATFDRMPLSAIATGYVYFVLPPEQIAIELVAIGRKLENK